MGIVEARPGGAHGDFVGIFGIHRDIEALQVIFSPVASVGRPALAAGTHPGIEAVKIFRMATAECLRHQQRTVGFCPGVHCLPDLVRIGAGVLRKNENRRPAVVAKVGVARRARLRCDVPIV